MRLTLSPWIGALLAGAVVLGIGAIAENYELERRYQTRRLDVLHELSGLRGQLESAINANLQMTRGLAAVISLDPEITNERFSHIAQQLQAQPSLIHSISLARHNVISHIWPPEPGDRSALGLNLMERPSLRGSVERAMTTRKAVISGPMTAMRGNGGNVIIARQPIFLAKEKGVPDDKDYWGLVNTMIGFDDLLEAGGITGPGVSIDVAIRGRDGQGEKGDIFFGETDVFSDSPVLLDVQLPHGTWQLAGRPLDGWLITPPATWLMRFLALLGAIVTGTVVFLLIDDQRRIHHLALHDTLTGLPNRRLLQDRCDQAIARASRQGSQVGLLHLDLDDFKPINDTHGHKVGDAVLSEIARRMNDCLRRSDTLARVGGDEFVVLLPDVGSVAEAETAGRKLIEALRLTIYAYGIPCHVGVSVGAAVFPEDGYDFETLLRNADRAMYRAKQDGKNTVCLFTPAEALV